MSIATFRSNSRPGYSSEIDQHPRRVRARKLSQTAKVRFTESDCIVKTDDGPVQARPGDAIMTGEAGEQWRVSGAQFDQRFKPVAPTRAGETGVYRSLRNEVLALQMSEPFEVVLPDGASRLKGKAGDWLVDYGDGSLGIVSNKGFATTYEVLG
jgi:hypothetical protein